MFRDATEITADKLKLLSGFGTPREAAVHKKEVESQFDKMLGLSEQLSSCRIAKDRLKGIHRTETYLREEISRLNGQIEDSEKKLGLDKAEVKQSKRKFPMIGRGKAKSSAHEEVMEKLAEWGKIYKQVKNRKDQITHEDFVNHCELDDPDFIRLYVPVVAGEQPALRLMHDFLSRISTRLDDTIKGYEAGTDGTGLSKSHCRINDYSHSSI